MVKIERSSVAPFSLAIEKAKGTKNYREQDVVLQLNADFHGKCYLCEIDELQSVEVEQLRAHRGTDRDLMLEWNTLFLCCPPRPEYILRTSRPSLSIENGKNFPYIKGRLPPW